MERVCWFSLRDKKPMILFGNVRYFTESDNKNCCFRGRTRGFNEVFLLSRHIQEGLVILRAAEASVRLASCSPAQAPPTGALSQSLHAWPHDGQDKDHTHW